LNHFNGLKTNYLKITAASRYIFSLVCFKKDAADKNPCLNETEWDKNKKRGRNDLFYPTLPLLFKDAAESNWLYQRTTSLNFRGTYNSA